MKQRSFLFLGVAIYAFLLFNSAHFFLQTPFYEVGDWAADSFSIDRAKRLAEGYGNYSRWGFHHPGPGFFYVQAFGEWLFFDKLHLVAAPYNGQVLMHLALMVFFFVAVLSVFCSWLPASGRFPFVVAALCAGVIHFGTMSTLDPDLAMTLLAPTAFLSIWNAHSLLLPFLCLLSAAASVAAGRVKHLPLLATAGGFLVHGHVAQPLFVVPIFLAAYSGLCREVGAELAGTSGALPAAGRNRLARVWKRDPRAHWLTVCVLAVFAFPILLDLCRGTDSNFAAILSHLRAHRGERHPFIDSLLYFLQFGIGTPYRPGSSWFPASRAGGALAYLASHLLALTWWLGVALAALWSLAAHALPLARGLHPDAGPRPDETIRHFLTRAGFFLLLSTGLTLVWGVIQDDQLYYHNAWFDFSIYHFALLCALALVCGSERVASKLTPPGLRAVMAGATLGICFLFAADLRISDPNFSVNQAIRRTVARVMLEGNSATDSKLLLFPQEVWPLAAGVALQLHRAAQRVVVLPTWKVMLGGEYMETASDENGLQIWRIDPDAVAPSTSARTGERYALGSGTSLWRVSPVLDLPKNGSPKAINFNAEGDAGTFEVFGWSAPETWGSWNSARKAAIAFHPRSTVEHEVLVSIDPVPFLVPDRGVKLQHLDAHFGGVEIARGLEAVDTAHPLTFAIPALLWNQAAGLPDNQPTLLIFYFPDAIEPAIIDRVHRNQDSRPLGIGFREMRFVTGP